MADGEWRITTPEEQPEHFPVGVTTGGTRSVVFVHGRSRVEDAKLMVCAVNAYEDLVAALEAALRDHDRPEEYGCRKSTLSQMEAALAVAKGTA